MRNAREKCGTPVEKVFDALEADHRKRGRGKTRRGSHSGFRETKEKSPPLGLDCGQTRKGRTRRKINLEEKSHRAIHASVNEKE